MSTTAAAAAQTLVMPGPAARLATVASHAAPSSGSATSRRGAASSGSTSDDQLLDDDAMRSFLTDGYVLLDTQAELPPQWHAAVAAKASAEVAAAQPAQQRTRASSVGAGAAVDQATLWAALSPELGRVTHSETVRSTLVSILGVDFVVSAGGHMHEAAALDQFWHRDGSVRGIREHAARGVIVMYYPAGCTLEMGTTAVCRGSQYLAVDRERWPNSEDRLDVGLPPPASASDDEALRHWRRLDEQARLVPSLADVAAREDALAAPIHRLGLRAAEAELRVVVPPGGVLLCHRECFHRATRPHEGAAWRPMFKMGASRVCDPVSPSWRTDHSSENPGRFAVNVAAVQALWYWHCGRHPSFQRLAAPDVDVAVATLADAAATEVARIDAAYTLGMAVAARHVASAAVAGRQLLLALDAEAELARRAGTYGLRAALFTPPLYELNLHQRTLADALRSRLGLPFVGCGGSVGGSTAVVYALAAAPPPYEVTATAVAAFCQRTVAELAAHTAAQPAERLEAWRTILTDRVQLQTPLDFAVLDRRLALSECCGALAAVGERAVRAGESTAALLVAKALLELVTGEEPGQRFPTFFGPSSGQAIRMQAAFALLRVCSDPEQSFESGTLLCSLPEWASEDAPAEIQRDTTAATVATALRRLRELCGASGKSKNPSHATREQLLAVLESAALPWRRVESDVAIEAVLQHCSTAAPFPGVSEAGVHSTRSTQ